MFYRPIKISTAILGVAFFPSALAAQTFDNSANSVLTGTYFVRELMFSNINVNGFPGTVQSALGTLSFDGKGNYSFNGMVMTSGATAPASSSIAGTYKCAGNQMLKIQSLFSAVNGATDLNSGYGGVGAVGPNAFVASATEGQNYDILIGIPIASGNSTLSGSYTAGYLGVPQANVNSTRTATFTLNAGAQADVSVSGSAANLGNTPLTQTNSGVTYSLAANGTGTINFGPASTGQLISGNQTFAVSADGNVLLGGTPGDFDLLIGFRSLTGSAADSAYEGTFFLAGVWDSVRTGTSPNLIAGVYGSMTATAQGVALFHWRFNETTPGSPSYPYDYMFAQSFTPSGGGLTLGANGKAALIVAGQGFYQFIVEFQAPAFSGSGVFLDPTGIVNTASYSPITTPIAPLEMVSLYGSGMSAETVPAGGYPLSSKLGGTQVLMNGEAAPLVSISPNRIVALVPGDIAPHAGQPDNAQWVKVQVINNGTMSNASMVRVSTASPGVFTLAENGIGEAAILHSDFSAVTSSHPAVAGETVLIYLTGLGAVTPALPDGAAAPSSAPFSTVNVAAYVGIDNVYVTPTFSGLAPGFAGLYQLNVVVPATPHSGDVVLTISVSQVAASLSTVIPIKSATVAQPAAR